MNNIILREVTPWSQEEGCWHFGGEHSLHYHGWSLSRTNSVCLFLPSNSQDRGSTFLRNVSKQTRRRHNPDGCTFQEAHVDRTRNVETNLDTVSVILFRYRITVKQFSGAVNKEMSLTCSDSDILSPTHTSSLLFLFQSRLRLYIQSGPIPIQSLAPLFTKQLNPTSRTIVLNLCLVYH
jgi:hypothetical protein